MSTSLTSILLHKEDINRRERAIANAEAIRLELKQQLLSAQQEVERSIFKFNVLLKALTSESLFSV